MEPLEILTKKLSLDRERRQQASLNMSSRRIELWVILPRGTFLVFLEKKRLWGGRYAIVVCRVVGKQFDVYYVSLLGMNRRGHLDQRSVFEASTCTYTSDNDDSVIPIFCWCAMLVDYGICMQKI